MIHFSYQVEIPLLVAWLKEGSWVLQGNHHHANSSWPSTSYSVTGGQPFLWHVRKWLLYISAGMEGELVFSPWVLAVNDSPLTPDCHPRPSRKTEGDGNWYTGGWSLSFQMRVGSSWEWSDWLHFPLPQKWGCFLPNSSGFAYLPKFHLGTFRCFGPFVAKVHFTGKIHGTVLPNPPQSQENLAHIQS